MYRFGNTSSRIIKIVPVHSVHNRILAVLHVATPARSHIGDAPQTIHVPILSVARQNHGIASLSPLQLPRNVVSARTELPVYSLELHLFLTLAHTHGGVS